MDRREQLRQARIRHAIFEHDEREFEEGIDGRLFVVLDDRWELVPEADPRDVAACERAATHIIDD
jgi:hypothetical protein